MMSGVKRLLYSILEVIAFTHEVIPVHASLKIM